MTDEQAAAVLASLIEMLAEEDEYGQQETFHPSTIERARRAVAEAMGQ
tara:strand:+ start:549 stop:692 length:144 start_codon:yes stop_codon:yes gene_type:complete